MSLMNTMTKMAVGFAVAKGMEAVKSRGGIGAVMEDFKGAASSQTAGMGGIGDLLGSLGGGSGQTGGLGDLLGQLTGGSAGASTAAAGGLAGLGGLLGSLAGARGGAQQGQLEALLAQDNPTEEPDEEEVAEVMLRAMLYAARSDGDIDPQEQSKLLEALKDGDARDMEVVQKILKEPVDAQAVVNATPKGLETQVYTMSLNAIDPDNRAEAEYLHSLAQGFGLTPGTVNDLHDSLAAPRIYQ
ncbi:MAG: DUF533 domain-containing protein [Roseobacter sp.]|jgi:uncharacterized membrane protein YebE (DUF533 family)|nr:DUF533 domain-containing protein [Roseobacter sp.]